jgi:hypothetical protein
VPDGLRYISHGDGTVTVSVCARLHVEQARPIFRMLMDAGLDGAAEAERDDDDGGTTT